MYYVVGLGNPGARYEYNRHNVGFMVCRLLIQSRLFPELRLIKKCNALCSEGDLVGESVYVVLPQTFMNASGKTVAEIVPHQESSRLILVYDDIDVPFGRIKISYGGGAGGHNGVASVVERLGTKDFIRLRIGIGPVVSSSSKVIRPAGEDLPDFVLSNFSISEQKELVNILETAVVATETIISDGYQMAMNQYN